MPTHDHSESSSTSVVAVLAPGALSRRAVLRSVLASAGAVAVSRTLLTPARAAAGTTQGAAAGGDFSGPATFATQDGHLIASNARLRVVFDGISGGVRSVQNLLTGQDLLNTPTSAPVPWRMSAQASTATQAQETYTPSGFTYEVAADGHSATLRWNTGQPDMRVEVRAVLANDGDIALWPRIANERMTRPPQTFTYPILPSLRTLSANGDNDYLIYPRSTGFLYRRPFVNNSPSTAIVYPDGYEGCTMQVMGYFEAGRGGFYFASHDPHATRKFPRFSQSQIAYEHACWDRQVGAGMELDYPVVIAPLTRGDWYEVAEHYRVWALQQSWCRFGPKWGRSDDQYARWLHEEVGIVVWAPSGVDWSPWYRYYAQAAGTPIQVVPGYDWSATRSWQKGYEGYFPANFHPANVEAWKGHRVTPYMNDLFISHQADNYATLWEPHVMEGPTPFPMPVFAQTGPVQRDSGIPDPRVVGDLFWFLCPVTAAQKNFHVWRDRTLVEQNKVDGITYDISFGNPGTWMSCDRSEHGHPPGAGRWMIQHFHENGVLSKTAMNQALGRYAAQATEGVIESIIDIIDYQQSRIVTGPQAAFEGRALNSPNPYERPPGQGVEVVPFFEAVYHDYGPVRQDGWGQISKQHGDIFYWNAARVTLQWGGLFELNYEYGYPEALPGHDGDPPASFTPYDGAYYTTSTPPEIDLDKAAFLREIATARTGFGNPWLGYGRVARTTRTPSNPITLDYAHTHDWFTPHRSYAGTWAVPQLLEAAWFDPADRLGLFFVNLSKGQDFALDVDVDASECWGLDLRGHRLVVTNADGSSAIATVGSDNHVRISLSLPPRKITLVALEPQPYTAA